jgi:hypothetical protein
MMRAIERMNNLSAQAEQVEINDPAPAVFWMPVYSEEEVQPLFVL